MVVFIILAVIGLAWWLWLWREIKNAEPGESDWD